ncbi:disease resistance protein RUN1-like [Arachis stenosperma]|uniref:disease resistance protein RUN1-like n=1 Tax=Arachis stenosperma TaxID=217475 RepID=UPI0025AB7DFB|nr:disease resistance protein RUN1-like [Arachis stenosperma]
MSSKNDSTLLSASSSDKSGNKSKKSSLRRKFRALLGFPKPSDSSPLGHPHLASTSANVFETAAPSSRPVFKYDVFLSFRGTDTRNTFVDHLYNNLIRKGIFTFMDDKRLHKGEPISSQLIQAIRDSRVSIVVFSKDYAGSAWCLEEMATIAECKKELGQKVFSIFYDVDPSHVRNQRGAYESAFLHALKYNLDRVARWKSAMTSLANSVGWDVRNKPEYTEIKEIIQKVVKTLNHRFSGFDDDLVGIQPRVERLEALLKLSSKDDNPRVIGICGMGGIGKTTHAKVLYDKISHQFDGCCFIENVSQSYRNGGAVIIQKQILNQALDEQNLEMFGHFEISGILRDRLSCIKVVIVLDNVDELQQLEELAISPKLLGRGSRIIIVTRNEHILKVYGADEVDKVALLDDDEARELLLRKALGDDGSSSSKYMHLIPKILEYAQNLPLAVKVVGSLLHSRDVTQWTDALKRMRKIPNKNIMDVLQISFEGLELYEKEIFLHIACFFHGEREDYVKQILDSCGLHPHIGIPTIMEKSLITIRNQEIHMHEMLQELGKKIVREKSPEEPGLWSRLWLYHDFYRVLTSATGSYSVKAIVLDQKEDVSKYSQLRIEGLSKMMGLKLLILHHKNFSGSLYFLSDNLQYISWHGYPFSSLPVNFDPHSLVELNLRDSNIKLLWESPKSFPCLKKMDLSNSKDLVKTPNFEWIPNLKWLDLSGCTNLSQVHPSIGLLTQLAYLSLRNCSNLVSIDLNTEYKLYSLKVLHLSGCTKLENTPDFTGLSNLEYLDLEKCVSLSAVHESIGALVMLKFFSLRGCINLVQLPASVNNLTCLQNLDLHDCFELMNLPLRQISMLSPYLRYLIFLDLGSSKIKVIPDAIGALKCLERLNLQGSRIQSLPETIKSLSCLAYLNLSGCHELVELHDLPFKSASSGGRYFKKVSEARNHRSGLYIFNCSRVMKCHWMLVAISWLARLVKEPGHFRCGFDIIVPFMGIEIPKWFFHHRFVGGSIIRILSIDTDVNDWLGFAFCVTFEVNKNSRANPGSSSKLPRPLYLSFESENTEECFDLPACLEMEKEHVGPIPKYCWIIYISRAHCHFVKTGTCITFKACPGLQVKEWGLRMVCMEDIVLIRREFRKMDCEGYDPWFRRGIQDISDPIICLPHNCFYTMDEHENEGYNRFGPKIQLPYNWNVTDEEEKENMDAKAKEINLYNLGHSSIEEEQVVNGHSSSEEEESMKMKGKALQVAFDEESDCSYMSDLSPR